MKTRFLKAPLVALTWFTIAGAVPALLPGTAQASVIYNYVGNNFTTASPLFTTSHNITGFVEFATAPTPGEMNKSDVVDFSFVSNASPSTTFDPTTTYSPHLSPIPAAFSFDFDGSLDITNWGVAIVTALNNFIIPRMGICNAPSTAVAIDTVQSPGQVFCDTNSVTDFMQFNMIPSVFSASNADSPGTWTRQAVIATTSIPSPGTLPLFLVGLAALGLRRRLIGG